MLKDFTDQMTFAKGKNFVMFLYMFNPGDLTFFFKRIFTKCLHLYDNIIRSLIL